MNKKGKLLFNYGTMSSGKSMRLMADAFNFQKHSIPILIMKSSIDTRDGVDVIYSRALGKKECVSISADNNIYNIFSEYVNDIFLIGGNIPKWILVDEAQFLTVQQVDELAAICDNFGTSVICYGLRTDFQTHLFEGSKRLFEVADSIDEIKSSCDCGCKTIFNARLNSNKEIITDGEQVSIGGDENYIPLCRKCYYDKTNHPLYKNNNMKNF